jgi:hypothetical protein
MCSIVHKYRSDVLPQSAQRVTASKRTILLSFPLRHSAHSAVRSSVSRDSLVHEGTGLARLLIGGTLRGMS